MTKRRGALSRLATGLLTATLAAGAFGAASATATTYYSTDTSAIIHNIPPEDLLANKGGVCNGAIDISIRNTSGAAGALRYLDAAQACGLKALLHFSTTTSGGTVYPSRVAALVNAVKDHPALFGYLSVKEPSWIGIRATEIRS